jgi:hypothetical protein
MDNMTDLLALKNSLTASFTLTSAQILDLSTTREQKGFKAGFEAAINPVQSNDAETCASSTATAVQNAKNQQQAEDQALIDAANTQLSQAQMLNAQQANTISSMQVSMNSKDAQMVVMQAQITSLQTQLTMAQGSMVQASQEIVDAEKKGFERCIDIGKAYARGTHGDTFIFLGKFADYMQAKKMQLYGG